MKVKELIERLLDEPMDSEIMIHDPTEHVDEYNQEVSGYAFHIDDVEHWSKYTTFLNFIDHRKSMPKGEWAMMSRLKKYRHK